MHRDTDVLRQVSNWAAQNVNVRAVILTSSRTNPNAPVDVLSDYDIELVVEDLQPFLDGDQWLETFGEILVRCPHKPVENEKCVWRLVMYKDASRIDFHIKMREVLEKEVSTSDLPICYDTGYEIILDKDGLTKGLAPPSYTAYRTKQPGEIQYEALVNEFWWDATYVAKYLWRDELFFAKYMLDHELHFKYLDQVIAWYIGVENNWNVNPGVHGRWYKKYLDSKTWADVEETFAGADIDENWRALFKTTEMFGRFAAEIGKQLGYTYPFDLEHSVTTYLINIKNLGKE